MYSSRVVPSTRSDFHRGFNDFESEVVSTVNPIPVGASEDLDHLEALQSVLGEVLTSWKLSFRDKEIEFAFVHAKSEQRQNEEFDFLEHVENLVAGSYLCFGFVAIVCAEDKTTPTFFIYVTCVLLVGCYWLAVKFVEKYFMRDSSLVAGLVTGTIALGYPLTTKYDLSSTTVAELSLLTVAHIACISLLSPVRTTLFAYLGAATVISYAAQVSLLLLLPNQTLSASTIATCCLSLALMVAIIAHSVLKDSLSRRAWIMLGQNAEIRKQMLNKAVKEGGLTKSHRINSRSSFSRSSDEHNENSQINAFFKRLNENQTMTRLKIDSADLSMQDFLGRGAMGEVYEAYYMDALVAFKRLPPHLLNKSACEQFIAEVKLLKGLRHPNIVQLMGVTWNETSRMVGMVLELLSRGSLRSVLQDQSLQLTWQDPKCKLAIDIAKAMSFLHGLNIIHRDLKTENVLVSSTFTSKVSDFGTSRIMQGAVSTPVGTPFWRAPEMIRAERYTTKADVYSFAMVLLEIATGENPFENMTPLDALEFPHKVAHSDYRLEIPEIVPDPIRKIITQCWDPNPNKRPPFLLIRRKLQKYLNDLSSDDDSKEEQHLVQVMIDQVVMSGEFEREKFSDGDLIIKCGDTGDKCYIVTKGSVRIFIPTTNEVNFDPKDVGTKWVEVDTVNVGNYFGEMGMYASTERSATCVAQGDVTCIVFGPELFASLDSDIQGVVQRKILTCLRKFNGEEGNTQADLSVVDHRRELQSQILKRVDTLSTTGFLKAKDDIEVLAEEKDKGDEKNLRCSKSCVNIRKPEEVL